MASEEITLKEFSEDRKELREAMLDLIARFERKYTGAEINSVRITRVDVTTLGQQSEGQRETVISALDLSIIVE